MDLKNNTVGIACGDLTAQCLFVVYLGFDNNSNSDIVFYGHKTPKSVEIYLSEKNIIYKIINDQKIS
ncbi:hypothetical protein UXB74_23085, partial [Escherichia marmotae]|nr:hypothetical protein [Escherichia marmotae]